MNDEPKAGVTRAQIAIRLLYTLLYLAVFCILKAIIREFVNKVVTYAYRLWRYITLNENRRPFPFSEFPEALEAPEAEVNFP
jgi:hypothetical protein